MKFINGLMIMALLIVYVIASKFDVANNAKALGFTGGLTLTLMCGLLPMSSHRFTVRFSAFCMVALSAVVSFSSLTHDARMNIQTLKEKQRLESERPTSHEINQCWAAPRYGKDSCKSELMVQTRDRINLELKLLPKITGPLPQTKDWVMWAGTSALIPLSLLLIGGIIRDRFDAICEKPLGITNTNTTKANCKTNQYKLGRKRLQIPVQIKLNDYQLAVMETIWRKMNSEGEVAKTPFWKAVKAAGLPGFSNYTSKKLDWWWANVEPILAKQKPSLASRLFTRRKAPVKTPKVSSRPAYQRGKVAEYIPTYAGGNITSLKRKEVKV